MLQVLNYIWLNIPWEALGAAIGVSGLLAVIKRWFDLRSERVMIFLVILFSLAAVAAEYLMSVPTSDPSIIALRASVLAFTTQPVYFFVIKPVITTLRERMIEAHANLLEAKSAAEPMTVAPAIGDNVQVQDFSQ